MSNYDFEEAKKLALDRSMKAWDKPRNPGRIDTILELLETAWKRHPDMRFTQLLHCLDICEVDKIATRKLNFDYGNVLHNNFYDEDDVIEGKILKWLNQS